MSSSSEKRHRLIHDSCFTDAITGDVHRFTISANNKLKFGLQPETTDELDNFYSEIRSKEYEFDKISERLRVELLALPTTLPLDNDRVYRLRRHLPETLDKA